MPGSGPIADDGTSRAPVSEEIPPSKGSQTSDVTASHHPDDETKHRRIVGTERRTMTAGLIERYKRGEASAAWPLPPAVLTGPSTRC